MHSGAVVTEDHDEMTIADCEVIEGEVKDVGELNGVKEVEVIFGEWLVAKPKKDAKV